MTIPTSDPTPTFGGAARARSYVEAEHTLHAEEVRAVRATARVDELELEPAAELEPPPSVEPTSAAAPAAPAPVLLPDLPRPAAAVKPRRATVGMRGVLAMAGLPIAPGRAERRFIEETADQLQRTAVVRQATWTRAVGILVANPKGGCGKTPLALLLAGTLATIRGGSVAVLEVADDAGALGFRAEGTPRRGVAELVRDLDGIGSAGQLAGYTAPQTSFAAVIGSVGRRPPLTAADVRGLVGVIDQHYTIRVMDSGNQPSSATFGAAVDAADVLVIPVLRAGDSLLEALALLEQLRETQHGHALARNAIVVRLADGRPELPEVAARVDQLLEEAQVRAVLDVPYDPHVAARGTLTLAELATATRSALVTVAAAVVESLHLSIR